jgi:hypothetical protein
LPAEYAGAVTVAIDDREEEAWVALDQETLVEIEC